MDFQELVGAAILRGAAVGATLVAFASTQLAGNLVTAAAAVVACVVYFRQTTHGNQVRDLQFIAAQRQLLSTLGRLITPPEELADYDADEMLAALEETAHAFNACLVGRLAVDYLKPQFVTIIAATMRNPAVRARWEGRSSSPHYRELVSFMKAEGVTPKDIRQPGTRHLAGRG